jgi:hypothetical protein
MSYQEKTMPMSSAYRPDLELEERRPMTHRVRRDLPARTTNHSGLLITGLAIVGLGALAWFYLGKDVMRYIRMETM